jgi:hypothetical protein
MFLVIISLSNIDINNADWITYVSKDKSFKIKFPNQPVEQQTGPQFGTLGGLLIAFNPGINTDDNVVYYISVTDYPSDKISSDFPKEVQDKFIKTQASVLIRLIGKPLSEEKITFKNYNGIYIKGEVTQGVRKEEDKGLIYVKVFLVKSRIYQLMTSCSLNKKDNLSINTFFDSFDLLEN